MPRISFRIPIFQENKPYMFIKTSTENENIDDYRLAVNNTFLKKYELNFKMYREIEYLSTIFEFDIKNKNKNYLVYRLPPRYKLDVIKTTHVVEIGEPNENDLYVDKYYIPSMESTIVITHKIRDSVCYNWGVALITKYEINHFLQQLNRLSRKF